MIRLTNPTLVLTGLAPYRRLSGATGHPAARYGSPVGRITMGKCDGCRTGFAWKTGTRRLRDTVCPVCQRPLRQTSSELIRYDWVALDVPAEATA